MVNVPSHTETKWVVVGHSMISPPHEYDDEESARKDYEDLISRDHYLGGKQSGEIFRRRIIIDHHERNR